MYKDKEDKEEFEEVEQGTFWDCSISNQGSLEPVGDRGVKWVGLGGH
jgi:hypothetical protein